MAKLYVGDYIPLFDADGHYAKGHLTSEQLVSAYAKSCEQIDEIAIRDVNHLFAFWGVGYNELGDRQQVLYTRPCKGRGRFPITYFTINPF